MLTGPVERVIRSANCVNICGPTVRRRDSTSHIAAFVPVLLQPPSSFLSASSDMLKVILWQAELAVFDCFAGHGAP